MSSGSVIRTAALASPMIWFASHAIQFSLAPLTCPWQSNAILWMVTGAALVLDLVSGWAAWIAWQRQPAAGVPGAPPMPRWLSLSGMVLSGSFFLVIAAQSIPSLMLGGCA
jgi:hypothetical protein